MKEKSPDTLTSKKFISTLMVESVNMSTTVRKGLALRSVKKQKTTMKMTLSENIAWSGGVGSLILMCLWFLGRHIDSPLLNKRSPAHTCPSYRKALRFSANIKNNARNIEKELNDIDHWCKNSH